MLEEHPKGVGERTGGEKDLVYAKEGMVNTVMSLEENNEEMPSVLSAAYVR